MTEQMYVIARMEDALSQPLVSESELRKRFIEATQLLYPVGDTGEVGGIWEAIDFLLHGEAVPPAKSS